MPEPAPRVKIGQEYGPADGRIDADAVLAYAHAIDDPNPVYESTDKVHPLYTVSLVLPTYLVAQGDSVEPGAIEGVRGGVHGEHDTVVHRPLRAGVDVTWNVTTHSAAQTPAGVLISQRIVLSDAEGPAIEHYWSTLMIGGKISEPLGPALADHTFPDDARTRPLGQHAFGIARDQAFRYGGASGDRALMHIDDEAARRAGFPSKFMQGLCTFAMCAAAVVKVAADGDPDRVRRLACRFSAPVFPGNDVVVDVFDAGRSEQGGREIAFEATSAGQTVIRHGRARVVD